MCHKGDTSVLGNLIQSTLTQSIDDSVDNMPDLSFAVHEWTWYGRGKNSIHFNAPFVNLQALTGVTLYVIIQTEYLLI
jgi:hypothetical protein